MIKLKSLLKENKRRVLLEMALPPGFGTNDFESMKDFVDGKEISNEPKSNLDFSKIGEAEGDQKFMGAPVKDFPDMPDYLKKVATKKKEPGR